MPGETDKNGPMGLRVELKGSVLCGRTVAPQPADKTTATGARIK